MGAEGASYLQSFLLWESSEWGLQEAPGAKG